MATHYTRQRYDVKISGGRVFLDSSPGMVLGITVQDPVYVFSKEDSVSSRKVLQQGDDEYLIEKGAYFGATEKARMFVTEYYGDSEGEYNEYGELEVQR